MPCALVIGIHSGIGSAVADALSVEGWSIIGTARGGQSDAQPQFYFCDLSKSESVDSVIIELAESSVRWDAVIVAPGTMEPIGKIDTVSADAWAKCIDVNFTNQMRLIVGLLPLKSNSAVGQPIVVTFAGGGTNSAPVGFSAYTLGKIALIKGMEVMAEEFQDVTFVNIGPGWVKTKIHQQALENSATPESSRKETERRLQEDDFVPMNKVVSMVLWAINAPASVVTGRNFSAQHDPIENPGFEIGLASDSNLMKLRRFGNAYDWMAK